MAAGRRRRRRDGFASPLARSDPDRRLEGRHRAPAQQWGDGAAADAGVGRPCPSPRSATARRCGRTTTDQELKAGKSSSPPLGVGRAALRSPSAAPSSPPPRRCHWRRCPKRLAVVGGGYIGLEFSIAFATLGAEVTVVEALARILPSMTTSSRHQSCIVGARRRGRASGKAKGVASKGSALLVEKADGKEPGSPPTRCWSRSGAVPSPRARAARSSYSTWTGARSASTISAGPRCAASTPSATSPASPCWRIARWRRARWWPRSWRATAAPGTKGAFRPCASPIRRSSPPACRRRPPAPASSRSRSDNSRSAPTAAP